MRKRKTPEQQEEEDIDINALLEPRTRQIKNIQFCYANKQNFDEDEESLLHYAEMYKEQFMITLPNETDPSPTLQQCLNNALHVLGLQNEDFNDLTLQKLDDTLLKRVKELWQLHQAFLKRNLYITQDVSSKLDSYKHIHVKASEILWYSYRVIVGLLIVRHCYEPSYDSELNDDFGLTKWKYRDIEHADKYEQLLRYILDRLGERGVRKNKDCVYRPKYNEKGEYTFSWVKQCTIQQFIQNHTKKECAHDQWRNLIAGGGTTQLDKIIKHLVNTEEMEFPSIKKNRHVFSFKNGIYFTKLTDINNEDEEDDNNTIKYYDKFITYRESITSPYVTHDLVSAKYFNYDFPVDDDPDDWYDIQTPNFQKILDYQWGHEKDYEEICRWMYVFLGRMMFEVDELDHWEVAPFLKGMAGCGKSTIIAVVRQFYDVLDVGELSNTVDPQFGLYVIWGSQTDEPASFTFLAPEIDSKFSLDQTVLQKMISGEAVVLRPMYKPPFSISKWTIPGWFCGNKPPSFDDDAGQFGRRFPIFSFKKKVTAKYKDPTLGKKLKTEMPAIIKKSIKAYLERINNGDSSRDVWALLPTYFKTTKSELSQNMNGLSHFLSSGKVEFSDDYSCKVSTFVEALQFHCAENGFKRIKFTSDTYLSPFQEFSEMHKLKKGIRCTTNISMSHPKKGMKKISNQYIVGLKLADDNDIDKNTKII